MHEFLYNGFHAEIIEFIPNFSGSLNNALEKAVIEETGLFGYTRDIIASIIIYSYNYSRSLFVKVHNYAVYDNVDIDVTYNIILYNRNFWYINACCFFKLNYS